MIGELANRSHHVALDLVPQAPIVEKRDVLRPRQSDHDAQAVPRRFVEQIAARGRVHADGVDAERRHQAEVFGDLAQTQGN